MRSEYGIHLECWNPKPPKCCTHAVAKVYEEFGTKKAHVEGCKLLAGAQ